MPGSQSHKLSGTDAFFLALEQNKSHSARLDQFCFLLIEIEGRPDRDSIEHKCSQPPLNRINSLSINGNKSFGTVEWYRSERQKDLRLIHCMDIENHFLETQYQLAQNLGPHSDEELVALFFAHNESRNTTTYILRWNHLLMDGMGAGLLAGYLFTDKMEPSSWWPKAEKNGSSLRGMYRMIRFISNSSKKPVFYAPVKSEVENVPLCYTITFNPDESTRVRELAMEYGAELQRSLFYLSSVCQAMDQFFSPIEGDFWVPLPVDRRKKGASSPVFSNQLTSFFYRIRRRMCKDKKKTIGDLREQMRHQLVKDYPGRYTTLLHWMKFLPASIRYLMVTGWKRKSHASFLFTMAPQLPFSEALGNNIVESLNIPPNSFPPGISFVVMENNGIPKLMILSRKNVLDESALKRLAEAVKKSILH